METIGDVENINAYLTHCAKKVHSFFLDCPPRLKWSPLLYSPTKIPNFFRGDEATEGVIRKWFLKALLSLIARLL